MQRLTTLLAVLLVSCSRSAPTPVPTASAAAPVASAPVPAIDTKVQAKAWLKLMLANVDKLSIRKPIERYTADTDPNHMLGRAHGYAEKIACGALLRLPREITPAAAKGLAGATRPALS